MPQVHLGSPIHLLHPWQDGSAPSPLATMASVLLSWGQGGYTLRDRLGRTRGCGGRA